MGFFDAQELSKKAICFRCVDEPYLSQDIESHGILLGCDYCNNIEKSITLSEMADRLEIAFKYHYSVTADQPDGYEWAMMRDKESSYDWERKGEETQYAIMNAAIISEEAAGHIQEILADRHSDFEADQYGEETAFGKEVHYEEIMPGDTEWRQSWFEFEKGIKKEARFFSRSAVNQLGLLFKNIHQIQTKNKSPIIVEAGPDTNHKYLYRARVFQSDDKLETALTRPDKDLSAPPSHLAASGRMNAKGISAFYGATSAEIALAEVRPPVGSQVALARFQIIRPLKLLDLSALNHVHLKGSIFDPNYARELGRMAFLRSLCDRMARPVMPDDQDFEYLPTQAVADFLATESEVPLDGILFPSVQAGSNGDNVVLFYKASRCESIEYPPGTDISASTLSVDEDGPHREYSVTALIPHKKINLKKTNEHLLRGLYPPEGLEHDDNRYVTLKIQDDAIEVHIIKSVIFQSDRYKVSMFRWEKSHSEPF